MRVLLDTCAFLWLAGGEGLSEPAAGAIREPSNEVLLSAASVWEILVKYGNGQLPLPEPPERLIPAERRVRGISTLPIEEEAVFHLARLPRLHRDPFDRMLICQAIAHGLPIVTPDPLITQYPVRTIW
jgi:PIN domain nuclease of toxin-antitoxin system